MTASRERLAFAKVFVEVHANQELPEFIDARLENGQSLRVDVLYDWKPPRCVGCKCFGHESFQCPHDRQKTSTGEVVCGETERDGSTYEAEPMTNIETSPPEVTGVSREGAGTERDGPTYGTLQVLEPSSFGCESGKAGEEDVTAKVAVGTEGKDAVDAEVSGGVLPQGEGGDRVPEVAGLGAGLITQMVAERPQEGLFSNNVVSLVQEKTIELPSKALEPIAKVMEQKENDGGTRLSMPPEQDTELLLNGEQAQEDNVEETQGDKLNHLTNRGKQIQTAEEARVRTEVEESPSQLTRPNADWVMLQDQAQQERMQKTKKKGTKTHQDLVTNPRVTRSKS